MNDYEFNGRFFFRGWHRSRGAEEQPSLTPLFKGYPGGFNEIRTHDSLVGRRCPTTRPPGLERQECSSCESWRQCIRATVLDECLLFVLCRHSTNHSKHSKQCCIAYKAFSCAILKSTKVVVIWHPHCDF